MHRFYSTVLCLLVALALPASAGEFKVGGHGGYTAGGDIDDEDFAWGGQVLYEATENVALEFMASSYSDEAKETTSDGVGVTTELDVIALTLALIGSMEASETVNVYALGGLGYFLFDGDVGVDDTAAAAALGTPGATFASSFNFDPDDEFGVFVGAGVSVAVHEAVEIFADYRYNFVEIDADISGSATASAPGVAPVTSSAAARIEGDFDHGVARVGVNFGF